MPIAPIPSVPSIPNLPSLSSTGVSGAAGGSGGGGAGSNAGVIAYEPHSPMANAQGLVRVPNVSLSTELVNLIQAQNGYQADTSVLQKAVAAYQAGLTIGS